MKPLSQSQKVFLYGTLSFGRLRWLAKPIYDGLLGLELLWHRFEDCFHAKDQSDVSSITAIIKTFERPYAVKRLVKSIRRRYPNLKIIVVDDSREPTILEDVHMITMPYNTGISVGRNQALDETTTPYFLLLDDDFVFSHRQRLGELLSYMETHVEVDIIGGRCIDLPLYIKHEYHGTQLFSGAIKPKVQVGQPIGDHVVVNKVQNFFVGRTATIKEVKWNPKLKTLEHAEFFTRACGKLVTVFHSKMFILHAKTPFDLEYLKVRFNLKR